MSIIEAPRPVEIEAPQREVTEADVLERAADLCGEFTWGQGVYLRDAWGSPTMDARAAHTFCALGAIRRAAVELRGNRENAATRFCSHLGGGSIADWNDAPGRTKAEVVAKLREAAARAREAA